MSEKKFRAWDKRKKEYTYDFVLAPTSPQWGAFPIEKAESLNKLISLVNDNMGVIDSEWKMELSEFICADYTLTDWANYYGLNNYIVEQFIGKKDKNNNDIYEGHILKFYKEGEWFAWGSVFYDEEETAFRHRFQEVYDDEPETGCWRPPKRFWSNDDIECEIIGNIHENPGLLE